ncbi:Yippee zinc-binding/DNA-binding /Mis18, centromere assembly [Popillia japonica]|uniref:Yippee zinc-binding/DNA-binding /Mis18, centromere assembly n=1 Tax=Popillia japonica TaxID=7064 RepID=A0AAW1L9D9_POPJA
MYSDVQDRVMLTGRHMVRDVSCKFCECKLGWMYEFATEDNQRYKEGRIASYTVYNILSLFLQNAQQICLRHSQPPQIRTNISSKKI